MIGVFLKISKNICFTVKLWLMEYIVIHCVGYMYLVLKTQKINLVLVSNIALKCLNAFSYTNKEANSKEKET